MKIFQFPNCSFTTLQRFPNGAQIGSEVRLISLGMGSRVRWVWKDPKLTWSLRILILSHSHLGRLFPLMQVIFGYITKCIFINSKSYLFHIYLFDFTRDMIIFFYDRKHSTFCQWEYMHSSHAHLKWHFKGWIGPRRHRSLGNLSGHQVGSKAADSESCLDWTQEAPKMRIQQESTRHVTFEIISDILNHPDFFKLILQVSFMICKDASMIC